MRELSKKIILVGNMAVGKTSTVNRFVHHKFSEQYISTIGVRIDKKVVEYDDNTLTMIVWDLAGENSQENTPQSYFLGTNGIIFVVDLSSPPTFLSIDQEFDFLKKKLPNVPILLAGNKVDKLSKKELDDALNMIPIQPDFLTSAKNGDGVEEMFRELGKQIIES